MEFRTLSKLIFQDIKPKLENHNGLSIFAKERAKFEGWLKVELCDSLSEHFRDVIPERDRIDITFEGTSEVWVIELKTINTSIKYPNVKRKTRPITNNVKKVTKDIEKLKSTNYPNKSVLFVVFPIKHDNSYWQKHFQKISNLLKEIEFIEFSFKYNIPGVVYFGLI